MRTRVNRKSNSEAMQAARLQMRVLQERRDQLQTVLQGVLSSSPVKKEAEQEKPRTPSVLARLAKSAFVQVHCVTHCPGLCLSGTSVPLSPHQAGQERIRSGALPSTVP